MIRLEKVEKTQENVLSNLLQKYLYELSAVYGDAMEEDGSFPYPWLHCYFTEPTRHAYFLYDGKTRVGFALVNTFSVTGESIDFAMAEFTIFPAYRRRGLGFAAAQAVLATHKGIWQIKFSEKNKAGAALWRKIAQKYHARETSLEDNEVTLLFSTEEAFPLNS